MRARVCVIAGSVWHWLSRGEQRWVSSPFFSLFLFLCSARVADVVCWAREWKVPSEGSRASGDSSVRIPEILVWKLSLEQFWAYGHPSLSACFHYLCAL